MDDSILTTVSPHHHSFGNNEEGCWWIQQKRELLMRPLLEIILGQIVSPRNEHEITLNTLCLLVAWGKNVSKQHSDTILTVLRQKF
jgi:hypothetical protein